MSNYRNEMVVRKLNFLAFVYGLITVMAGAYWDTVKNSLSSEKIFILIIFSSLLLAAVFMLTLRFFITGLFNDNNPKVMRNLVILIATNVLFGVFSIYISRDSGIQNMPPMYAGILIVCFINLLMNITSIYYVWSSRRKSLS